ncbi:WD40-repeat-containing domain protein [Cyathus striatus]|nr:WD40-repeat-containing domain protein [Cyathus striatus]
MNIDQQENNPPPPSNDVDMRSPPTHLTSKTRVPSPSPVTRKRSLSPAHLRKKALAFTLGPGVRVPRSYTVEAICALPHPVPTHALASSFCMTHLLTGSDDGYIRDYDIFTAVNGKNFLTAPQRHHAGVVEGLIKSAQIRFWWENPPLLPDPTKVNAATTSEEDPGPVPVYSLAMHSDALWSLAGTDSGHINLFTLRHEPGRLVHVMNKHKGPVSSLCLDYDEKGFFSAGWDGEALQWDLNNGQVVRNFTAHGAQLAGIAVRPISSGYTEPREAVVSQPSYNDPSCDPSLLTLDPLDSDQKSVLPKDMATDELQSAAGSQLPQDMDAKSDASFDPLFDDDPDEENEQKIANPMSQLGLPDSETKLAMPGQQNHIPVLPRPTQNTLPVPKNAPPLLDPVSYASYSPDLLMTASIDGQVILWDRRVHSPRKGVGRLWMNEKTPPWCHSACWSADGSQIYAGRRNGTVDVWDVRQLGYSGLMSTPRLLKILRNPLSSGVVSCVVAFPDGKHIACASVDNLRLWNVAEANEPEGRSKSGVQFKIIPGHHGGYISQMLVDPGARFLVSASSNRGWHGESTRTVFVHDIKAVY